MIKESDLTKEFYKTGEVAKFLGVSPQTIISRDKAGKIPFHRSDSGRRILSKSSLISMLDEQGVLLKDDELVRHDVIYARVSTNKQKSRGDLDRQVSNVLEYAQTQQLSNVLVLKEVGSGLNDNRKEIQRLIRLILQRRVKRIFVNYKDRLTRFGFRYLETICKEENVEIHVVSQETSNKTVQEELAEDLVSIIHSFSGKLYGLRRKQKSKSVKELEKLPIKD